MWNPATPGNAYARMAAERGNSRRRDDGCARLVHAPLAAGPRARHCGLRAGRCAASYASFRVRCLARRAARNRSTRIFCNRPAPPSMRLPFRLRLQAISPGSRSRRICRPYGYVTHAAPAQTVPVTAQVPANAHLVLGTDLPAPPERRGAPRTAPAPGPVALNAPATLDLHGRSGVTGALGVPLAAIQPQSEGIFDWLTVRGGAVAARKSASSPQLRLQTSADGSVSLSVPATTRERTLRVYVTADRAQGTLTATLGDSTFSDSSLEATGGARKGVYTLVYRGTAAGQVLNVRVATSASFGGTVAVAAAALTDVAPVQPPVDQTQYHNDISRSGWNPNESILTPASVGRRLQRVADARGRRERPRTAALPRELLDRRWRPQRARRRDRKRQRLRVRCGQRHPVEQGEPRKVAKLGRRRLRGHQPDVRDHVDAADQSQHGTIYVVAATEPTTSNFHTTLHALSIATR